jgi:7-carboxy-7-deazaguanine synthase
MRRQASRSSLSRREFEWAEVTVRKRPLAESFTVLMSPVVPRNQEVELAEWLLDSGLEVRMQLQLHKYIWPPDTKGV